MQMDPTPRAPRFAVGGFKIVYDTGDGFWTAPVVNASESGMFVETHHDLPLGTEVTIMPDGPFDDELPFELHAEVVRVSTYDPEQDYTRIPGLAFQFLDLGRQDLAQLRVYLEQNGVPWLSK